jgi:hypothetical protein
MARTLRSVAGLRRKAPTPAVPSQRPGVSGSTGYHVARRLTRLARGQWLRLQLRGIQCEPAGGAGQPARRGGAGPTAADRWARGLRAPASVGAAAAAGERRPSGIARVRPARVRSLAMRWQQSSVSSYTPAAQGLPRGTRSPHFFVHFHFYPLFWHLTLNNHRP